MEIYKDVEGYENLYQVSNMGNVKSLISNKILKPAKNHNGYLYVCFSKQGKHKHHKIHRLVAQAFIDNPNSYPIINHRDENKTNNCVSNLEWCDHKYNINYGTAIERRVVNTDYKARTANTDYKARTAKTDYKARTAKTDYAAKVANTNYKAIALKNSKKVLCIETGKIYDSTHQVERETGFSQGNISNACTGRYKQAYGYTWRYVS